MKKRRLIALAALLVASIGWIAWIFSAQWRFATFLQSSCQDSSEVTLERYYQNTVLKRERLNPDQLTSQISNLSPHLGRLRYSNSKCWIPHHRIFFRSHARTEKLEICFTCDELWTEQTGRRKIPELWKEPLRDIFRAAKISAAAPDWREAAEYLDKVYGSE